MKRHLSLALRVAVVVLVAGVGRGRPEAQWKPEDAAARFTATEAMIPVRDGIRLHTRIFVPKAATANLPFIFERTPYGVDGAESRFAVQMKELADEGYIFVFQDIRGRYESEGTFVMQRPPRDRAGRARRSTRAPTPTTPSTGCCTNVPREQRARRHARRLVRRLDDGDGDARAAPGAQGRVAAGVARRHVARRRLPPQRRLPPELRLRVRRDDGDDEGGQPTSRSTATTPTSGTCALGPLVERQRAVPARQDSRRGTTSSHTPTTTRSGSGRRSMPYLKGVTVPTLNVAGWWDQEDFYGPIRDLRRARAARRRST